MLNNIIGKLNFCLIAVNDIEIFKLSDKIIELIKIWERKISNKKCKKNSKHFYESDKKKIRFRIEWLAYIISHFRRIFWKLFNFFYRKKIINSKSKWIIIKNINKIAYPI